MITTAWGIDQQLYNQVLKCLVFNLSSTTTHEMMVLILSGKRKGLIKQERSVLMSLISSKAETVSKGSLQKTN